MEEVLKSLESSYQSRVSRIRDAEINVARAREKLEDAKSQVVDAESALRTELKIQAEAKHAALQFQQAIRVITKVDMVDPEFMKEVRESESQDVA